MDEVIPEERAPRDFRAKFPDDVLQGWCFLILIIARKPVHHFCCKQDNNDLCLNFRKFGWPAVVRC